jgi:phosphoglycerate dehydrogenase-like enzyme
MNAKRLAFMKPDAYVINVGRGPLIDDAALIEALTERPIGGAGIEVFEQESPCRKTHRYGISTIC